MPVGLLGLAMKTSAVRSVQGGEDGVDVGAAVALGHLDRGGAGGERGDPVHAEAVLGVDHLAARAGVGLGEEGDDLVGAGAADDAGGVEAVHLADRPAQGGVVGRGIEVQARRRAR